MKHRAFTIVKNSSPSPKIGEGRVRYGVSRAFTLVELLVVIAVIGLLSTIAVVSLSTSRIKARDAKRIADLKQISTAVELYISANGHLPTYHSDYPTSWCTYIWHPSYPEFITDIAPFMPNVPTDPKTPHQGSDYFFRNFDGFGKYALCGNLEQDTGKSYDYSSCTGSVPYNYCIFPNGT
jgi:prepilin-type N-terminal cleavage/methylation domain-containing protein